ncbi:MAG TPA: universal stress protein [Hyphomicrobiaceae bacterium]|nr:universal stress protein [Hyphomicrobiaceae bacterium]
MAIHTVLIHLNDRRRASRLISAAKAFSGSDNARLIGLHVFSAVPPVAPVIVPFGDDIVQAIEQAESRDAAAIEATFRKLTAAQADRATWICERAAGPDLAHQVMQHGRGADLIVASAADADWEMAPVLDFPERLAMESGRPLLMIPNEGTFETTPSHVVIAWNGSREAARAGFDTVALFGSTVKMTVLAIGDEDGDEDQMASARRFADTVARHGVSVTLAHRPPAGRSVGEAISAEVAALRGDLLVMGAYGHSRVREFVFGGVSRHVTHHLKLPTLLSH